MQFIAAVDQSGNPWVNVVFQVGMVQASFMIPAKQSDVFLTDFDKNFRAAAKDARRKASGLVLPGDNPAPLPIQGPQPNAILRRKA